MLKLILAIVYTFVFSFSVHAEDSKVLQMRKFLEVSPGEINDISYLRVVPQVDENPDPNKQVTVEFFSGEFDGSKRSIDALKHMAKIIAVDTSRDSRVKPKVIATGTERDDLKRDKDFDQFLKYANLEESHVSYETVPEFLDYTAKVKNHFKVKRLPSSDESWVKKKVLNPRVFWTVTRTALNSGGVYVSMHYFKGLPPSVAFNVALWPGLASGIITYNMGVYGDWLSNESWAKWLMQSDNKFAKSVRKVFGLNVKSLEESMVRHKKFFSKKYPKLYNGNPELFDKQIMEAARRDTVNSKARVSNILRKLGKADEYLKWYVTEVLFTGLAIKLPQVATGVAVAGTIGATTGEILWGSVVGMGAQGFGDMAVQRHKYLSVEKLKADILSGKKTFADKDALLEEIEKVLARKAKNAEGKMVRYVIHDGSHKALRRIENWAMARATALSVFSVAGVGLHMIGMYSVSTTLLVSVGASGFVYYGAVAGWIKTPKKLKSAYARTAKFFERGLVAFPLQGLRARYCGVPFAPRPQ